MQNQNEIATTQQVGDLQKSGQSVQQRHTLSQQYLTDQLNIHKDDLLKMLSQFNDTSMGVIDKIFTEQYKGLGIGAGTSVALSIIEAIVPFIGPAWALFTGLTDGINEVVQAIKISENETKMKENFTQKYNDLYQRIINSDYFL